MVLRSFITLLLLFCACTAALAQPDRDDDEGREKVYRVKPLPELGAAAVGLGGTIYAFQVINDKDRFAVADYDRADVPGFDRWAFPENLDRVYRASGASDIGFYAGIGLPFTLFADREIRRDWLDVTTLYLQAQAVNGILYAASPMGPLVIDRARPSVYYPELFADGTADGGDLNGFFSGHVSTTAVGTFFFAKVLSDYHPEWSGRRRALLFGLASLPPAYVSVQRVRALKHFPSDTVVGFAIGAAVGVLTPHLHKRWQEKHRSKLGLSGAYTEGGAAAGLTLTF